jgi:hypothetical protein
MSSWPLLHIVFACTILRAALESASGIKCFPVNPWWKLPLDIVVDYYSCYMHDDQGLASMHLDYTMNLLTLAAIDELAHQVAAISLPAHEPTRFQALANLASWGKQEVLRCARVLVEGRLGPFF